MSRFDWRAAEVVRNESGPRGMIGLSVRPREWIPHTPGQHCEIRFPGDEVSRKFSIASAPETEGVLEFGIEVLDYGLLTPRLVRAPRGEPLEIRGPTGAGFTWSSREPGPLILLGAGSGVTPLLSMYGHHRLSRSAAPLFFLVSAKSPERLFGLRTLREAAAIRYTQRQPRVDRKFLQRWAGDALRAPDATARICGPKGFMDTMVDALIDLGMREEQIRSEAFV